MTTSIVATILLMYRKGISKDLLVQRANFIYEEIIARNGLVQINIKPNEKYINKSLAYLSEFVESKNGIVLPNYQNGKAANSIMMLSYYRNHLVHIFINDAEIATSLYSVKKADNETIFKKTEFLKSVLNEEFVLRDIIRTQADFDKRVLFLNNRNFLTATQDDQVSINVADEDQTFR